MSGSASVIHLVPPSQHFVDTRTTSLGPWVLGAFLDCILMGVIFCQTYTFFRTRTRSTATLQTYYYWLVLVVVTLSMLKTAQGIAVVWVQNVIDYANPDVARTLVATAWWQVSTPLMTGVIGATVQGFFCLRFFLLSRNWAFCIPILLAICLGLAGVSLSLASILANATKAKVTWLLVHLVGVFIADVMITGGTIYYLQKRNSGLDRTKNLINRMLRLVFEGAIPPAVLATTDLIMTQTLGDKLLWHLFVNMALGKAYVVSLMFTLNQINEYRLREQGSQDAYSSERQGRSGTRRQHMELANRAGAKTDQIFVQTQISTHVSPSTFSPTRVVSKPASFLLQEVDDDTKAKDADYIRSDFREQDELGSDGIASVDKTPYAQ
ncbi:unnamed protein product [Mycena citricolor]|uniref:DUF6534 domain-containing protein n=1 Tax=Mycena citricolor TaxID=2018698 RepID=A0AAD2H9C0_9AGAR|nr:unnamed protein product [Mycena citricolor]